ncbi:DivIVA domain-containing protein [Paucilactobacillus nenjiangensis]|uniref:DivIVA domain-containing protein n=1 Tax=Paucilactobacillus nenjiangensis TaxID=1296540 RepID=A0A5P1X1G7_9LACO|nr:DivIVA domain-containing protein [Paucilactobacillus nenjiangensis]QER67752.1 hypothetical protein F0161_07695 [Paucilactobacillus nenjiangensis]
MDFSIPKIKNNRFKSILGGYSYQQVDEFFADILGDLEALKATNRELKQQDTDAKRQLAVLSSMKEEIVDLIVNSQKYSVKVKERARRQAMVTVRFANQEADQIVTDAHTTAKNQVVAKINEVKLHADSLAKLKVIVATYQDEIVDAFKQQVELVNPQPKVVEEVEPAIIEPETVVDNVEEVPVVEQNIAIDVADQQIGIGIMADDDPDYPVMVHKLDSTTQKDAVKIKDISTSTNADNELVINLSLVISK